MNVYRLLENGLTKNPDAVALASLEKQLSWIELDQEIDAIARGLLAFGLRPGDRVASLMPNRADLLAHYLGCMRAGLVAVPLNYRYMPPEIDHALTVSKASALLFHEERMGEVEASSLVQNLPLGKIVYGAEGTALLRFEDFLTAGNQADPLPEPDAHRPAVIFFTSGSTGLPKGATHSAETLGWMLASSAAGFEFTAKDIVLPGSSISHLGGFLFSLAALGTGARVLIARAFDGEEVLPLLRTHKPTVLCMLPAPLLHLVRDYGAVKEDFSSLRMCRSGSDKVPAELEKEFTELTGVVIDEGYGMTEVGLAALNPPSGLIKTGSIGKPLPGFEFSVRDDEGSEVPVGSDGRLWMKTKSATTGYWENTEATSELIEDGWLDSGDLMKADKDGYLWFRGRKKQIIVHDGSNICPQEVEDALLEHHSVASAGVVGVHDLLHGENVRAYVVLQEGERQPSRGELIEFARKRIGYKAPAEIEFLGEMPFNATGKVDRVKLKKMAAESHRPS
ncbi:MAG: class I adenylate-forming enzyme family protein [Hyphomicrobiales bacterium]